MKVIQIGFNRCGTTSLNNFLDRSGLKSVHWDKGNLAKNIAKNVESGRKPLDGYEEYNCFTDLEYVGSDKYIYAFMDFYKQIDKSYDDALFILNIRSFDKWIRSRLNHGNYVNRFQACLGLNEKEVVELWKKMWFSHISDVESYFEKKSNLIVFDIDKDPIEKVCDFLRLDRKNVENWGHFNKRF